VLATAVLLATACSTGPGLVDDEFTTKVEATAFFPAVGPATGGIPITIVGDNFREGAQVFFGDKRAEQVTVLSKSTLEALLPAGDFGPVLVAVAVGDARVLMDAPFRYRATHIDLRFEESLGVSDYDAAFGGGDQFGEMGLGVVDGDSGHVALLGPSNLANF